MTMAIPAKQRWIVYLVALALTLAAVKWAGGQDAAEAQAPAADRRDVGAPAARDAPAPAARTERVPALQLERLGPRAPVAPAGDPFQARSWAPAPDPGAEVRHPAPRPQAPPLPFAYMGRMVDDGTTTVFLAKDDRNFVARTGETLDGTYRVEKIDESGMVVTYLPLKIKQTLSFGDTDGATGSKRETRAPKRADDDDDD